MELQSSLQLFDISFAITKFSFCGDILKCIQALEQGISKVISKDEIAPLLVIFDLPYGKYMNVGISIFTRAALLLPM